MVAQSYYYSKGAITSANRFSDLTGEKYDLLKAFMDSYNKYVYQFLKKINRKNEAKIFMIEIINKRLF
ncbi:MAG: hypothetical protein KAG14_00850 [Mycoplasmataceae bacterium]|nr:hypothetical protein [Mycoplasmataceae bacterium]